MKIALGILSAIVFFGVVGFFMFKNRPVGHDPIKIINPTYFIDEAKVGRVVSRRFYTHLKEAQLVIIGSSPLLKNQNKLWHELIKASYVDGIEFNHILSIEGLPSLTDRDQFFTELSQIELGSGRTLIHVPSDELWKKKVEETFPHADYIIFQTPFSLLKDRQRSLGLECKNKSDQGFACLAYKAGTRYYRKKLKENRLTVMMEQIGLNFYMIFIGEPY